MATSGTVSQTTYTTQQVVDRSYRLCKMPPETVVGEMLQVALDELFLLLSSLANKGVPLWCIKSYLLPMYLGRFTVPCPPGTVDILNANLRSVNIITGTASASEGVAANAFDKDLTTACVQTTPAGNIKLQLDTAAFLTTVGIMPGATGTWDVSLQYSLDNVTWVGYGNYPAFAAISGEWQWFDFQGLPEAAYWRLKANGATVLNIIELAFANTPSAIPFGRLNKDDYYNQPNRMSRSRPTEYWFDRQLSPVMQLWPAPNTEAQFQQVEVEIHQQIQDVGTFSNSLAIPQSWFDPICFMLAKKLCLVTPEVKPGVLAQVKEEGDPIIQEAWANERDDSPINLSPDISPYTRG